LIQHEFGVGQFTFCQGHYGRHVKDRFHHRPIGPVGKLREEEEVEEVEEEEDEIERRRRSREQEKPRRRNREQEKPRRRNREQEKPRRRNREISAYHPVKAIPYKFAYNFQAASNKVWGSSLFCPYSFNTAHCPNSRAHRIQSCSHWYASDPCKGTTVLFVKEVTILSCAWPHCCIANRSHVTNVSLVVAVMRRNPRAREAEGEGESE
jgi:hypothetical protein